MTKSGFARQIARVVVCAMLISPVLAQTNILSHPPLRTARVMKNRPPTKGPSYYVDPIKGSDENEGSEAKAWKTIQASLLKLHPGDTLYLKGGIYFENVYCSISGTAEAPITIRSKPGELAILDGGISEFETNPGEAWEPVTDGGEGEFRSRNAFPNIRDVVGLFGDSNIGLQTYWHPEDMRTTNEVVSGDPQKQDSGGDIVYCGPGIWYNRATGHIHVRLAPTHLDNKLVSNYTGEKDPRKLPLVLAPFNSTPLFIDMARHIHFYDLVIRGGGLNTVNMRFGMDLEFEHVTIFGGTNGLRSKNSGRIKFINSAIFGGIPPWAFYGENALHIFAPSYAEPYAHEGKRNVARMTAHALLVMEGFEESDVFAYPFNNHWEIAYSEFADGHDGIYPNGFNIRVHDNWIGNMQDDAVYISSPTRWVCDDLQIYRNYITGCTTAFGAHGRGGPEGSIYIYGNVVDTRYVGSGRFRGTTPKDVQPYGATFFGVHGGGKMQSIESIYFYYNTAIVSGNKTSFMGSAFGQTRPGSIRHVANNIFVYTSKYPAIVEFSAPIPKEEKIWMDGNVHWSPDMAPPADWLKVVQDKAAGGNESGGWEKHSTIGSPNFIAFSENPDATNDYRIGNGSATGTAQPLPAAVKLEGRVGGKDVGAFQMGEELLKVGVEGQIPVGAPAR